VEVFVVLSAAIKLRGKKIYNMTFYIYKRNKYGSAFQLGWAFTKKELKAKLEKYSFWKQNGYEVFFIER